MLPSPAILMQALVSLPLFSLVVAAVVSVVFVIAGRTKPVAVPARYTSELRALGVVSVLAIVAFAVENIVRGYLLRLVDVVDWWRYPTPILAAAVGLAVVGVLIAVRGSAAPELPVAPTAHRSWMSFGPRLGLALLAVTVGVLIATSVAAGLASSADREGRFIYLEIGAPNVSIEPVRPWFFGWSYGVPVMISVAVLAVVVWFVLSRNAVRPFLRPGLVTAEESARRRLATAVVSIATGATLLALGGVFRFIGDAGTLSQLTTGENETYELVWRYGAIAAALGWTAPFLEIVGFILLLLTAIRGLRRPSSVQPAGPSDEVSE